MILEIQDEKKPQKKKIFKSFNGSEESQDIEIKTPEENTPKAIIRAAKDNNSVDINAENNTVVVSEDSSNTLRSKSLIETGPEKQHS